MPSIPASGTAPKPASGRPSLGVRARRTLLLRAALPAPLATSAAAELAHAAVERRFAAGDVVIVQGMAATSAWLLVEGGVALGAYEAGTAAPQRIVVAGHWLDLPSSLLQTVHPESAVAASPCSLLEFPMQSVLHGDPGQPQRLLALATLLAAEVMRLSAAVRGFATKDATGRIANWLMEQASAATSAATFRMLQRKRDIAAQLGISAETFSRALGRLRDQGLIGVNGRSITLLDVVALGRVAGAGSSDD